MHEGDGNNDIFERKTVLVHMCTYVCVPNYPFYYRFLYKADLNFLSCKNF